MPNAKVAGLVRLNTLSPVMLTKYLVRAMMADGAGRIVNGRRSWPSPVTADFRSGESCRRRTQQQELQREHRSKRRDRAHGTLQYSPWSGVCHEPPALNDPLKICAFTLLYHICCRSRFLSS